MVRFLHMYKAINFNQYPLVFIFYSKKIHLKQLIKKKRNRCFVAEAPF